GVGEFDGLRRQDLGPGRDREYLLAGAVLGLQFAQSSNEAVAGVGGEQHALVVGAHHQPTEQGAGGRVEAPGGGLALAARGGQAVGGQRVGSTLGVEQDGSLV